MRFAVGLLGEKEQAGWWPSSFMSPTSSTFLLPVFGANIMEARYQGIVEAGKRVHDERIGGRSGFSSVQAPRNNRATSIRCPIIHRKRSGNGGPVAGSRE